MNPFDRFTLVSEELARIWSGGDRSETIAVLDELKRGISELNEHNASTSSVNGNGV